MLAVCFLVAFCVTPSRATPPQVQRAANFSRETRNIWRWIQIGRFVNHYPIEFKQFLWTSEAMQEVVRSVQDFETITGVAADDARDLFLYHILGASRTNFEEVFDLKDEASRYIAKRLVNRYHASLDVSPRR